MLGDKFISEINIKMISLYRNKYRFTSSLLMCLLLRVVAFVLKDFYWLMLFNVSHAIVKTLSAQCFGTLSLHFICHHHVVFK